MKKNGIKIKIDKKSCLEDNNNDMVEQIYPLVLRHFF